MRFFQENRITTIVLILLSFYMYQNFTRIVEPNPLVDKTSHLYVNDFYMSDGRIYNEQLTKQEKKMYDFIFEGTKDYKKKLSFKGSDYSCLSAQDCFELIEKAHYAILIDHPELLNYSGYSAHYLDNEVEIRIEYAMPFELIGDASSLYIERQIDKIKQETKDMSDLDKIKYVYEWIGKNNTYDKTFMYNSKNQSIFNVFLRHNAVCAGFAKTSQVIFQNIGIKSYTVVGESTGPHMWNIIEVDGKYYYFDSTVATAYDIDSPNFYWGLYQENMNFYSMYYPEWYGEIETTNLFTK